METKQNGPVSQASKDNSRITYATITSTIGLVISLMSFYFSNLRESHSLQFGVINTSTEWFNYTRSDSVNLVANLILLNRGNRAETLLSIETFFPSVNNEHQLVGSIGTSKQGPLVLKPGDAMPIQIKENISEQQFRNSVNWTGPPDDQIAELIVIVIINSVSPEGNQVTKKIELERYNFRRRTRTITTSKTQPRELELVELTEP